MGKEASKTKIRDAILAKVVEFLEEEYDTYVREVKSGEYTMLIPDENGDKLYANVKISIPRGTRNGTGGYDPYDGYAMAKEYAKEIASKEQEKAAKKAMKEAEKGKTKEQKQVATAIKNLEKAGLG